VKKRACNQCFEFSCCVPFLLIYNDAHQSRQGFDYSLPGVFEDQPRTHACKGIVCFGHTLDKMRVEACNTASTIIASFMLLILAESTSNAQLVQKFPDASLQRHALPPFESRRDDVLERDCSELFGPIQQMCPYSSGRVMLSSELDYFECPAAMCNFITNFKNTTTICRVEWSRLCSVDENGTDTCCPQQTSNVPLAQVFGAWNSSSSIDNSRERSIIGYLLNVSIPPRTFQSVKSAVQLVGHLPSNSIPFPPAYTSGGDSLLMQDVPRRPITVQLKIWNETSTRCKAHQRWVLFHYDQSKNAWIPLANQVASETHIYGQILPSMAIRNRLLVIITAMLVHVPTPALGISPFDFSLANEMTRNWQNYWNTGMQPTSRCSTVTFTRGDRRVDKLRSKGLVAIGTPVQREWDSVPRTAVQLSMMIPSAAASALQEAVLSPVPQRRLLQQQLESGSVWASFYNETSGEWEELQNCTYSASSSTITCDLQPDFFSRTGLQVMFAPTTSNTSTVASAMASEEQNQISLVLTVSQQQVEAEYRDLMHWYRFDNASNPAQDDNGAQDITLGGNVQFQVGDVVVGKGSIRLPSVDDYILLHSPEYGNQTELSFSFWMKKINSLQNMNGYLEFFSLHTGSNFANFANSLYFGRAPGTNSISIRYGADVVNVATDYNQVQEGVWLHYAVNVQRMIVSGVAKANITFFVNGTFYSAPFSEGMPNWQKLGPYVSSNRWFMQTDDSFPRILDDVRLYRRSLTTDDVKQIMDTTCCRDPVTTTTTTAVPMTTTTTATTSAPVVTSTPAPENSTASDSAVTTTSDSSVATSTPAPENTAALDSSFATSTPRPLTSTTTAMQPTATSTARPLTSTTTASIQLPTTTTSTPSPRPTTPAPAGGHADHLQNHTTTASKTLVQTTETSTTTPSPSSEEGLPSLAIAGIVLASLCGAVALTSFLAWWFFCRGEYKPLSQTDTQKNIPLIDTDPSSGIQINWGRFSAYHDTPTLDASMDRFFDKALKSC